jgi:hypothetical protein
VIHARTPDGTSREKPRLEGMVQQQNGACTGASRGIGRATAAALARLPAPAFPNDAAGSEGPTSWQELLKIRGNTTDRAIGYGR